MIGYFCNLYTLDFQRSAYFNNFNSTISLYQQTIAATTC